MEMVEIHPLRKLLNMLLDKLNMGRIIPNYDHIINIGKDIVGKRMCTNVA